jgi:hypothetical protein
MKEDLILSNLPINIEKAYPEAYRLARRFHEFYEQSAPAFGYKTKEETKEFDPESANGRLMAWVCYEIVKEEKQKLGKEICKLATEPIWDKNQDIRYQDIKTRTPKELCQAIDDLVDLED